MTTPRFPTEDDHRRVKYLVNNDERLKTVIEGFLAANSKLMVYTAMKYGEELGDLICSCAAVQTAWVLEDLGYGESAEGEE